MYAILQEEELKDSILLVFANKQDQKGALNAAQVRMLFRWICCNGHRQLTLCVQISEAMGLSDIRNRQWSIKETTATQGAGLFDGFDWCELFCSFSFDRMCCVRGTGRLNAFSLLLLCFTGL